jgi:hypothetical protein
VPIAPQKNAVLSWELAEADRQKILEGNARGLFES